MRSFIIVLGIAILVPLLLSSTCLTIDPPLPARLSAPQFTSAEVIPGEYDEEIQEMIHVEWVPDTTDTISIYSFQIVRQTDVDSFPIPITNIPNTVRDNYDPVYFFNLENRTREHLIFYWIFAVDSLGRAGDTSTVFGIDLARVVTLVQPYENDTLEDTLSNIVFRWLVPSIQLGPCDISTQIWKSTALLWTSDTAKQQHIPSEGKNYTESLPASLVPLTSGVYLWGVSLTIYGGTGANDPTSITTRKFYVK